MKPNVIGGEFEVSPDLLKINNSKLNYFGADYLFSTGRAALYNILLNEVADTVIIPDYICGCVPKTVVATEKKIFKYHVNSDFTFEFLKEIQNIKNPVVLLVNFFGLVDVDFVIKQIKEIYENPVIILDDVQSLWDLKKDHKVDYVFSSFRKWLPVQDGAPVKTSKKLVCSGKENIFAKDKIVGSLLKFYRDYKEVSDVDYLNNFEQAEQTLDENWNCEVSSFTRNILNNIDYEYIAAKRRNNAIYLCSKMGATISLMKDKLCDIAFVPMFVPIFLENRNEMRKKLMKNNIFCPVHWPFNASEEDKNPLYDTELSLICDQRYSADDMEKIVKILNYGK
ncbi:hypothetical protein [uncultured Treponema sp.]|uniref:hypothetical protein n=1 Tax=uncultured Treponema sp. TaxID=162155 RepID=UPI0025F629D4|nr:hypothetical protein [uncultured Treponema sp.]